MVLRVDLIEHSFNQKACHDRLFKLANSSAQFQIVNKILINKNR